MDKRKKEEFKRLRRLADRWGRDLAHKRGIEHKKVDPDAEKLSTNIQIYAKPLFADFFLLPADFEPIVDSAILLWNFSLFAYLELAGEKRSQLENELIHNFRLEPFLLEPHETMNLIADMEKYWRSDFSHDLRFVIDQEYFYGETSVHFSVLAEDLSEVQSKKGRHRAMSDREKGVDKNTSDRIV